jgi:integrase
MATVKYRVKTNNKLNSILLRFKQGSQFDTEVSTRIKVPKGKFSSSQQRINPTNEVDYKTLNTKLVNLKVHIINQYSSDSAEGVIINNKWLRSHIDSFFKRKSNEKSTDEKHFLSSFMQYYIDTSKKRLDKPNNPIKYRTIQHYQTTKNKLNAYEKYTGKLVKLTDVDMLFHESFIEYLEVEQKLNPNTIGGYLSVIKRVCKKAELKGYKVNINYKSSDFSLPSNKTKDTYLTLDEIHKINNYKFKKDYLDNARDWLIIGVWTGLRVSDLLTLNKLNIDGDFIQKDTLKTDFPVYVPMHNHVKKILDKRNGDFPRKISDPKFNEYIKEVCKVVGLTHEISGAKMSPMEVEANGKNKIIHRKMNGIYKKYELISSHVCRRSFATNHYGKLDTLTIMKITGHKTESQFLRYIKITPMEYALKLKKYWEKINVDEFVNS